MSTNEYTSKAATLAAVSFLSLLLVLLVAGCSSGPPRQTDTGTAEANAETATRIQGLLATDDEQDQRALEMASFKVSDFPSDEERRFWTRAIKKIWMRPPCCGACSAISQDDFRELAKAVGENAKDTPENRQVWQRYGATLVAALRNQDPELYKEYLSITGQDQTQSAKNSQESRL